jgi:hypothetical protein
MRYTVLQEQVHSEDTMRIQQDMQSKFRGSRVPEIRARPYFKLISSGLQYNHSLTCPPSILLLALGPHDSF